MRHRHVVPVPWIQLQCFSVHAHAIFVHATHVIHVLPCLAQATSYSPMILRLFRYTKHIFFVFDVSIRMFSHTSLILTPSSLCRYGFRSRAASPAG